MVWVLDEVGACHIHGKGAVGIDRSLVVGAVDGEGHGGVGGEITDHGACDGQGGVCLGGVDDVVGCDVGGQAQCRGNEGRQVLIVDIERVVGGCCSVCVGVGVDEITPDLSTGLVAIEGCQFKIMGVGDLFTRGGVLLDVIDLVAAFKGLLHGLGFADDGIQRVNGLCDGLIQNQG